MSAVLAMTDKRSILFQILFAVFDSLQGFVIVMVHCILRREVEEGFNISFLSPCLLREPFKTWSHIQLQKGLNVFFIHLDLITNTSHKKFLLEIFTSCFSQCSEVKYCTYLKKLWTWHVFLLFITSVLIILRSKMLSDVGFETAKTQSAVMQQEPSLMDMLR